MSMIDADCHYGDHLWLGGGACVRCGTRLRCYCGQYVREENLEEHLVVACPVAFNEREQERQRIEVTFAP